MTSASRAMGIFLLVISTAFLYSCAREKIQSVMIPRAEKIEATEVLSARNTIVEVRTIGLGGGVGVGMGAAEINCQTEDQFLELLPQGERVFTSVEVVGPGWERVGAVRRYMALLPDRAGVIIYEIEVMAPRFSFDWGWPQWCYNNTRMKIQKLDRETLVVFYRCAISN